MSRFEGPPTLFEDKVCLAIAALEQEGYSRFKTDTEAGWFDIAPSQLVDMARIGRVSVSACHQHKVANSLGHLASIYLLLSPGETLIVMAQSNCPGAGEDLERVQRLLEKALLKEA